MSYHSFLRARFLACSGLLLCLSSSCGGQTTSGSSNAGKEAACSSLCQKSVECGGAKDAKECSATCAESELVSRAGQELLTRCAEEQECAELGSLDALQCTLDGLFDLPVSETQRAFCEDSLDRLAECASATRRPDDVDNCLTGITLVSDEFVSELAECAEKSSCDLVNLCAGVEILGVLDTDELEAVFGAGVGSVDLGDLLGSLGSGLGLGGPGSPTFPPAPDPPAPPMGGAGPN